MAKKTLVRKRIPVCR